MKTFYFVGILLGIFVLIINIVEFDLQKIIFASLMIMFFLFNLIPLRV